MKLIIDMKNCDFCKGALTSIYKVPDTSRGAVVSICDICGLVQTVFTKKKPKERMVSTSSGAGWGNIRHGKGLRLDKNKALLQKLVPWQDCKTILDIGANRGDFIHWISEVNPRSCITAVEPDSHVVDSYKDHANVDLVVDRFEHTTLQPEYFDFIYCFHTLEHADSALEMLNHLYILLKTGGYAFIEVPNIDVITENDVVEEFFIDKHKFHFNRSILLDYLRAMDCEIIFGEKETDKSNITFLIQKKVKRQIQEKVSFADKTRVTKNTAAIGEYARILEMNRGKLKEAAEKLEAFMKRQKVVLWGAGRIFDALVRYGGLSTEHIYCLVDSYLAPLLPEVHEVPIKAPNSLRLLEPDVVIVLAKTSTVDIEAQARKFGIRHVIKFSDLF